jgi:transcriptional regulator with GAF, ATPase, and Fis domain
MASQRSNTDSGDTRARDRARIVIVDCRPSETEVEVNEVMVTCRVTTRRVSPGTFITRDCDDCGIALVAVDGQPSSHAPVLDDVQHLSANGFTVLCYANGAQAWPIGVRCRLLVSGASEVLDSGATAFADELRRAVNTCLEAAIESEREAEHLTRDMRRLGVIGSGPRITAMFRAILRVSAVSDLPVLIVGETGTGKELAARAIHQLDHRRRDRPFIAVNCGAINAGIAESDLFGHRRGAFTGAAQEREGLFRAARGGVLFLDEIGDLELVLQAKLLRVLQERRVLAVGDDHEQPVDVRVVAATNRDLDVMVARHAFRADLFHRLNVLTIHTPALRDRPEDIDALVEHFVAQCAGGPAGNDRSASREFVDAVRRLHLPGNVRQLENVVRRAVVHSRRGEPLRLSHLTQESWLELIRAESGEQPDPIGTGGESQVAQRLADATVPLDPVAILNAASWKLEGALDICERQLVAAALGASRGNRSRAARLLGISPRCIFNKMRKHRLTA